MSDPATTTRADHLAWCKKRALEYVDAGQLRQALASMSSDLGKHPETEGHATIGLGLQFFIHGHLSTAQKMRQFIEGFN